MIEHNYNGIYGRNQADGIVLSLPFAPPSMASRTSDQAPNYRIDEVSNFNVTNHEVIWNLVPDKAAQGRYHPPDMVVVLANVATGSLL